MIAAAALVALPATAQANALGTCALGTFGVTFTPGLGLGLPPNLPSISVGFVPAQSSPFTCQLLNLAGTEHAEITALSGTMNASCLFSNNVHWAMTITWTDRSPVETSTVDLGAFIFNITNVSKVVTLGGTVTSGRFTGQTLRLETVSQANSLQCLTNSLTETSGQALFELT
jgi:hypothetical protein